MPRKRKASRQDELIWMAVAAGAGMLATSFVRSGMRSGWRSLVGDDPPENPAARDITWKQALGWAVASGVAIGVANVLVQRSAAAGWERWRGELPPGL